MIRSGMSHEHIIASVLYCYSNSPNIEDSGLAFRAATGLLGPYEYEGESPVGDRREWKASIDFGKVSGLHDVVVED